MYSSMYTVYQTSHKNIYGSFCFCIIHWMEQKALHPSISVTCLLCRLLGDTLPKQPSGEQNKTLTAHTKHMNHYLQQYLDSALSLLAQKTNKQKDSNRENDE